LKDFKKIWYLIVVFVFVAAGFSVNTSAQDRDRLVKTTSSRPVNQPAAPPATDRPVSTSVQSRPVNRPPLVQDIQVARPEVEESKVKKIVSSRAVGASSIIASRSIFSADVTSSMQNAIYSKLGIPYLYGSSGPRRYDCSGFVWAVFGESGMHFTRQSARSLWSMSEPVSGDERFRFGTLVFLNGLGHMGIVADENGFYHASSSKGITYSKFEGYWANRIVGFRKLNLNSNPADLER
jgi:cell wall-associated NlpC family hydrolase